MFSQTATYIWQQSTQQQILFSLEYTANLKSVQKS